MKKRLILSVSALCAFMGFFSSCGDGVYAPSDGKGRIALNVGLQSDIVEAEIISKAVTTPDISVGDLYFKVTSVDGSFAKQWDLKDFNSADEQFPVGDYKVEVGYGDPDKEDFDIHAYYDTQNIKVLDQRTTDVSLTAARTHAYVTVSFTDAFKAYLSRAAVGIVSASGKTTNFAYSSNYVESRTASIVPGLATIYVDIEKANGTTAEHMKIAQFNTLARYHYSVTLDVNGGEVGSPMLTVSFDDSTDEEDIAIDISDEMLNTPAPELECEGVTDGATLHFVEGCWSGDPVKVNIVALGGIGSVTLDTRSTSLRDVRSWPESVDLVSCDQAKRDRLAAAGLVCKGFGNVVGRMASIDFSNVFNNITYIDSDPTLNNVSTFSLAVVDNNGKTLEAPFSFNVEVEKMKIEISNPTAMTLLDTTLDFDLAFNGGNPEELVSFAVQRNNLGTGFYFDPIAASSIEKTADNLYRVSLTDVPAEGTSVVVRAQYSGRTADLTVDRSGVILSAADNDVFASYAYISLSPANVAQSDIDNPKFVLVSDNDRELAASQYSQNIYRISGLTPATVAQVKAVFDDADIVSTVAAFTTESNTQLPDAGFDNWSADKKGDLQYLWKVENSGSWATMNALTTSQSGSGTGSAAITGGCSYKATSGTIPANGRSTQSFKHGGSAGTTKHSDGHTTGNASLHTDKARSGANAALIRTVGWGSGNTAAAYVGFSPKDNAGFGTCQNMTVGQLYLGKYENNAPVYGIGFASRPSAVEFYYHYDVVKAGNGDYASAEVVVKDANDKTISSKKITLSAQSAYTKVNIPLEYNYGAPKAAKISVVFKSSENSAALAKDTNFWNTPGHNNTSGGEYVGSELYIDDIQLIY